MAGTPNLYGFATKELAQDATLAYIMAWADPQYRTSHQRLHALGTELLRALLATQGVALPRIETLVIETQVDRIDIVVQINTDKPANRIVLIIEDKVSTQEHSNQIERYKCVAKEKYKGKYDEMVAVYLKTGNESEEKLPSRDKCGRFLRKNLLDVLDQFKDTNNVIVNDFRTHLQSWEDNTNRWRSVHYNSWQWSQREGFYAAMEDRWRSKYNDWSGWGYVSNPSGGFLGWWGGSERIGTEEQDLVIYLQIDNGTRLTVRLGRGPGNRVRSPLMHEALLAIDRVCIESPEDILCEKAGRFRGGKSADVAKLTFAGTDPWLAVDADGLVDVDVSVERLCRARKLIQRVAAKLTADGLLENS